MSESPSSAAPQSPAELAVVFCHQQREAWTEGRQFPVEYYLQRHSLLRQDSEAVLDLIYNEIVLREESGSGVHREEFLKRFPDLAGELQRLFDVHEAILSEDQSLWEKSTPHADGKTRSRFAETRSAVSAVSGFGTEACIANYEVLEEVGRGGMGIVYKARQGGTNRIVALKVVLTGRFASDSEIARFRTEAESAARLDHPGIVPVYEVGQQEDLYYLSMGYVEGENLAEAFARGPMPPQEAARLVCTLAEAVHYAHSQHVIHRDLKPQNILLEARDPGSSECGNGNSDLEFPPDSARRPPHSSGLSTLGRPRITDFGLARQSDRFDALTITGQVLGTPHYMAPEQALGKHGETSPATDVYALGAILYEAMTGRPPFEAAAAVDVLWQVVHREPVPPRVLAPFLSADLETIALKCLEKDPHNRYRAASELADDLRRCLAGEPIKARRISPPARLWRWCRRNPILAGLTALTVLLLMALAGGSTAAAIRLHREQAATLANLRRAESAEQLSTERLFESHLAQARLGRRSRRAGQRLDGLEAISRAVELLPKVGPDSETLVTLRSEAIACLALTDVARDTAWRLADGPGHTFDVLCFDARVERYALPDDNGAISIRGCRDNALLVKLNVPRGRPEELRFSPDGRFLAGLIRDGGRSTVSLWRLDAPVDPVRMPGLAITAFDFAADSRTIAVVDADGAARLLGCETGDEVRRVAVPKKIRGCRLHPRDHVIAVWRGPQIFIVDLQSGKITDRLTHESGGTIESFDWSSTGRLLACGTSDHHAYVWDYTCLSGPRFKLSGHQSWVKRIAFGGDDRFLMTAAPVDGTTRVWNPWDGTLLVAFDGTGIRPSRDGARLGGIDTQDLVRWSVTESRAVRSFHAGELPYGVYCGSVSPDGRLLATVAWDGVRLWDVRGGEELAVARRDLQAVAFAPDSAGVVAGGCDGLFYWPIRRDPDATGASLADPVQIAVPGRLGSVRDLAFSGDGETLAVAGSGYACTVHWDHVRSVSPLMQHRELDRIAVSPDGRWVATAARKGFGIKVWERSTDHRRDLAPGSYDTAVAFSQDGRLLVGATAGRLFFWNTGSWELSHSVPIDTSAEASHDLAFSPDGRLLAVACARYQIKLLDAETGGEFATLPAEHYWTSLRFSQDGHELISTDEHHGVRIWDLPSIRRRLARFGLDWNAPETHRTVGYK